MRTQEITNSADCIDTRDVLERLEYLASEVESLAIEDEEIDELARLACLIDSVSDVSGDAVEDGASLIRDSYFKEYAEELADDIGAINKDASWPNDCIDWDQAARELQMDYSSVDFGGVEYWVRS